MSNGDGQKAASSLSPNQNTNIIAIIVIVAMVAVGSWKASEYVGENNRVRDEVVRLRTENTELKKELEKYRAVPPGWRPGTPIGSPTGSTRVESTDK